MTRSSLLLSLAVLLAAPLALAAPSDAENAKKAKDAFQYAQKLYKQARYTEAIAKFEEAYAAKPHPVIYFNIGRCYEQLNETGKALRAYRDYLRLAPDAKDRETVSDAMANLERRLKEKGVQQLMVFADPPSARIDVDGKDLGTSPASVELPAGNHKLTVKAEGYDTVERSFVMSTSRAMEMTIALRQASKDAGPPPPPPPLVDAPKKDDGAKTAALTPDPAKPPPPEVVAPGVKPKKGRVFTWVAAGVAVAGAGAATGLGLAANGSAAQLRDGTVRPQAEAQGLHDSAQGLGTGATVAWAAAGAAAVTAVVLFFVEGN